MDRLSTVKNSADLTFQKGEIIMNKSKSCRLIIILVLFLLIQGCSLETPTPIPFSTPLPEELRRQILIEYNALIGPFVTEWLEVSRLATEWGRTDMLDLIIRMQEIRNEVVGLEVYPTLEEGHSQLILHMDCQIAAHAVFIDPGYYSIGGQIAKLVELLEEHEVIFERCSFPVVE